MSDIEDGGPAFPHEDSGTVMFRPGLSKRELFAAILMHSEAVTCGVPGEAADALVQGADLSGQDVVDHMATNAVESADALLRALGAPPPVKYRELYVDEMQRLQAAERLAVVVGDLKQQPAYEQLSAGLRHLLEQAAEDVTNPPLPF